jgi:hypothetical protein
METLGRGGYAEADVLTVRRPIRLAAAVWWRGDPKQPQAPPGGPLMSRAKLHAGGGSGVKLLII